MADPVAVSALLAAYQIRQSPTVVLSAVLRDLNKVAANRDEASVSGAIEHLKSLGIPAVRTLIRLSRDSSNERSDAIVKCLIGMGKDFTPELEKNFKNPNEDERFVSAAALSILYPDERIPEYAAKLNQSSLSYAEREFASIILCPRARSRDADSVRSALKTATGEMTRYLIYAVGSIGNEEQRNFLLQLVENGTAQQKIDAVESLGRSVGTQPLVELMGIALKHKEASVRRLATQALKENKVELGPTSQLHEEFIIVLEKYISEPKNGLPGRRDALNLLIEITDAKKSAQARVNLRDSIETNKLNVGTNPVLQNIIDNLLN